MCFSIAFCVLSVAENLLNACLQSAFQLPLDCSSIAYWLSHCCVAVAFCFRCDVCLLACRSGASQTRSFTPLHRLVGVVDLPNDWCPLLLSFRALFVIFEKPSPAVFVTLRRATLDAMRMLHCCQVALRCPASIRLPGGCPPHA